MHTCMHAYIHSQIIRDIHAAAHSQQIHTYRHTYIHTSRGKTHTNPEIVFVSFGGPTPNFHRRVNIICHQMRQTDPHIINIAYTEDDLHKDHTFWGVHQKFVESHERGYGHWLWKAWLIYQTLQRVAEGDILIYADSGCTINPHGVDKLHEYIGMVKDSQFGMLAFSLLPEEDHMEYMWSKKALFDAMKATHDDMNSAQLVGGIVIFKKTIYTMEFVQKWYETCCVYSLIDDTLSDNEHPEFASHRDDQSVFSLLVKRYLDSDVRPIILQDETYYAPNWHIDGINFPIWATRFKTNETA
jgi:hypothetical protein